MPMSGPSTLGSFLLQARAQVSSTTKQCVTRAPACARRARRLEPERTGTPARFLDTPFLVVMKAKVRQSIEDDIADVDQQQAQFYEGEEVDSE